LPSGNIKTIIKITQIIEMAIIAVDIMASKFVAVSGYDPEAMAYEAIELSVYSILQ
jgi:hypothetical protein